MLLSSILYELGKFSGLQNHTLWPYVSVNEKNVYTEAVRIHPRVQIQINFLRVEIVRSQVIAQIVTQIEVSTIGSGLY